jgi:hypothetical protein
MAPRFVSICSKQLIRVPGLDCNASSNYIFAIFRTIQNLFGRVSIVWSAP